MHSIQRLLHSRVRFLKQLPKCGCRNLQFALPQGQSLPQFSAMVKPQGTTSNIWTYATHGDVSNLQRLLAEGELPDHQNKLGESAAQLAARNGHVRLGPRVPLMACTNGP